MFHFVRESPKPPYQPCLTVSLPCWHGIGLKTASNPWSLGLLGTTESLAEPLCNTYKNSSELPKRGFKKSKNGQIACDLHLQDLRYFGVQQDGVHFTHQKSIQTFINTWLLHFFTILLFQFIFCFIFSFPFKMTGKVSCKGKLMLFKQCVISCQWIINPSEGVFIGVIYFSLIPTNFQIVFLIFFYTKLCWPALINMWV